MKEIVATKKAPEAIGPYSQAVKIGASELLFCSGQIPLDPATGEITGVSAAEQTQQVMDNLRAVIQAGGYTMADVVKTTIYLAAPQKCAHRVKIRNQVPLTQQPQ